MSQIMKIGIDLGTTNTVVGFYNRGKIEFLKYRGKEMLSSVLAYKNNKISIGEKALKIEVNYPHKIIRSSKTFMGNKDEVWEIEGEEFTPVIVATEILKYVKKELKNRFSDKEEFEAVITVPAYFETHQVEDTKRAAEDAGIKVKSVYTEPVAAAVSYGYDEEKDQNLFIIDIGGGTFDVAILEINENNFNVKVIEGDNHLGGDKFDEVLVNRIERQIKIKTRLDLSSKKVSGLEIDPYNRIKSRIRNIAERVKKELSEYEEVIIHDLTNLTENISIEEMKITRREFELYSKVFFNKIKETVDKALKQYGDSDDIDKVVLVGGSSRIPKIREIINNKFGLNKTHCDKPVDKMVSEGAVYLVDPVRNTGIQEKRIKVSDILSHSLGLAIGKDYEKFHPILKKGEEYPIEKSETFVTTVDYQKQIELMVYEKVEDDEKENKLYEKIVITGLSLEKKGELKIKVTFKYDENRVLHITAKDNKGSINEKLKVNFKK